MSGIIDACDMGFSPDATGLQNSASLQQAVDRGGTILVSRPGVYPIAATVFVGSHTSLEFAPGVILKKVDEAGAFTHVILNKGALTREYDRDITIRGLQINVNGIDVRNFLVYGLHGQLAFFYAKDVRIERFRCFDLGSRQYGIHVCSFEDLVVDDVMIRGDKDGVHLGRGKRFTIRNGVFETFDDAIALNAHDYDVGNPEMGWIEDGVVENCHDRWEDRKHVGFFCRILAGAWTDWRPGMIVQKSDTVVSAGRLYRVYADPDERKYVSTTPPTHETGAAVLDGIKWVMAQRDLTYTAGVRNVVFRDIFLGKARTGFSIHFDHDKFSRSYYPGSPIPVQEQLTFQNIHMLHEASALFLMIGTPVDVVHIINCSLRNNSIAFRVRSELGDHLKTQINMIGCTFRHPGPMELLTNAVPSKSIVLKTSSSTILHDAFTASINAGPGNTRIESDLPGLKGS